MARQLRIEYPGAYYHVTSRGNERKDIFKSQRDREKFLEYLASATERYGAAIHVYGLMSNHYPSSAGNARGESVGDYEAHKRCLHNILQYHVNRQESPLTGNNLFDPDT